MKSFRNAITNHYNITQILAKHSGFYKKSVNSLKKKPILKYIVGNFLVIQK